jgi:circadian clock protein KaiB
VSAADIHLPQAFKGIALFTPGGDLVYCIDANKQERWHLQLCAALQDLLNLSEPPHFLVPCYTATVDRWMDPKTQQLRLHAEAHPLVIGYQPLLNVIFQLGDVQWQPMPCLPEVCDPRLLASYRQQFPQLWESHELAIHLQRYQSLQPLTVGWDSSTNWTQAEPPEATKQGYVLRLFVSGHSIATQRILQNLYRLLEEAIQQPYTLRIVDVRKHPEQAEIDQVMATPTLVKAWPLPVRRLVGDLEDVKQLLTILSPPSDL